MEGLVDGCVRLAQCMATWPMRSRPSGLGAKFQLTTRNFAHAVGITLELGSEHVSWVWALCVRFGAQFYCRFWEKLQRRIFFSFFGQTSCRKSLDRGFWIFWSHWSHLFFILSIVLALFEHIMKMSHWKLDQEMQRKRGVKSFIILLCYVLILMAVYDCFCCSF